MSETTIPADFPPLLQAAEEAARETYDAGFDAPPRPNFYNSGGRDHHTRAHARLLADLTRPASRDYWARYLAQRVGLAVGATAPTWTRGPVGSSGRALWQLTAEGVTVFFAEAVSPEEHRGMGNRAWAAPGITTEADPATALLLVLLALPVTP